MNRKVTSRFLSWTCVLALAASAAQAHAHAANEAVSPRLSAPIRVDGRLDEPAWGQAAALGRLVTLGDGAASQRDHADARVAHDGQALYLAVVCRAAPAGELARLGRNNSGIWGHDRVEVFVDAFPETGQYYQLVVDRAGNIWDAQVDPTARSARTTGWDGEWRAVTRQTGDGWIVEMAVPYSALAASVPQPGDLWRLKVCRDGGSEGPLNWPHNPTGGFHSRNADGALYFEQMNLLLNADFEEGEPAADGVPRPWRASLTSSEVNNALQGTVETVPGAGAAPDSRAVRMTKLASAMWWPQIWSSGYNLAPGAVYEFSITARGDLPQINLRANCMVRGQVVKMSQTFDTPSEWSRLRYLFRTPEGATVTNVGLAAPRVAGAIFFDQAMLRRALAAADALARHQPLTHDPDPDAVQGLYAFMERQGHKPYDLFQRGEELMTLRVMFQDRQFGTQVWMLDNSPTVEHGGTASVWSPWNINASTIYVEGRRYIDGRVRRGWFIHSDFSRMRRSQGGRPAAWAPEDPDLYYGPVSPVDKVTLNNWRTGEQKVVAEWKPLSWPASGKRVYGLTRDRRHIFVDLPNRGIFVPFKHDENHPIPQLPLYDGRPIGPGGKSVGGNHFCAIYKHEEFGDLIALRTGMLVDRETGERTNIAAPLCGNTNYLRAFHEGRVRYPQGREWNAYGLPWFADGVRLPTGLSMEELYDLWLNLPHATHGHESTSPDWQYITTDGGTTRIVRVRDGQTRSVRLSPNGGNYHVHWRQHPRFFVGWVRGWRFGSYMRPVNANVEFQVFCDTTFQPIVDTKHRFNGYYSGGDFSMLSPDATKIHYGSSMTGRFKNYIAVMARPRPPQNLSWRPRARAVVVSWEPSAYSRETRGYLVHRSETSGDGYRLLTPQPVEGTSWRDATARPRKAYYYVVTSLEHSGLESGYSEEAARAGVTRRARRAGPLVVYAEAEDAVRDLPTGALPGLTMGVDRTEASDWYYLYRHPESERGQAELAVNIPADGRYHLWARMRSARLEPGRWEVALGGHALAAETDENEWTWARAGQGHVYLEAGRMAVRLATTDATAQMDLLCLATDERFVPAGPRPEDRTPPPPPVRLQVENVRERVNRLVWNRPDDPRLSHYQVYASPDPNFEPGQETLVGSPTYGEFIDWGLRAGTRYHYAVTAVDRRGNQSAPARAKAATPPRTARPVEIELAFVHAELAGPFERSEAGGLRAPAYVVPQDPKNNRAAWRVEIPRKGTYYLWLRHLRRGTGARGGDSRQTVRVRANGQAVARLGGGSTDINVRDSLIAKDHPLAPQLWTWAWPGTANLEGTPLPAGKVELVLDNLAPDVRYDVLLITDEPSFVPQDGRLRQR